MAMRTITTSATASLRLRFVTEHLVRFWTDVGVNLMFLRLDLLTDYSLGDV